MNRKNLNPLVAVTASMLATAAYADAVDNCADAVNTPAGTHAFDLFIATNDGTGTCGASAASPDQWFKHTASVAGTLTVSTCGQAGFDTVLALFNGCGGTQLACVDDSCGVETTVSTNVTAGQTVYIRIAGYGGEPGSGNVVITAPTPPGPGTVFETGDAGDLASTAMVPAGTGPINEIRGALSSGADVDLFVIRVAEPTTFSASTDNAESLGDTQLWLFSTGGVGLSPGHVRPGWPNR